MVFIAWLARVQERWRICASSYDHDCPNAYYQALSLAACSFVRVALLDPRCSFPLFLLDLSLFLFACLDFVIVRRFFGCNVPPILQLSGPLRCY